VDDIEDEWMYGNDFDYVHIRHLIPALKGVDKVLDASFKYVSPFHGLPGVSVLKQQDACDVGLLT
jgi:hypothetical protein